MPGFSITQGMVWLRPHGLAPWFGPMVWPQPHGLAPWFGPGPMVWPHGRTLSIRLLPQAVAQVFHLPSHFIKVIHFLESSWHFNCFWLRSLAVLRVQLVSHAGRTQGFVGIQWCDLHDHRLRNWSQRHSAFSGLYGTRRGEAPGRGQTMGPNYGAGAKPWGNTVARTAGRDGEPRRLQCSGPARIGYGFKPLRVHLRVHLRADHLHVVWQTLVAPLDQSGQVGWVPVY